MKKMIFAALLGVLSVSLTQAGFLGFGRNCGSSCAVEASCEPVKPTCSRTVMVPKVIQVPKLEQVEALRIEIPNKPICRRIPQAPIRFEVPQPALVIPQPNKVCYKAQPDKIVYDAVPNSVRYECPRGFSASYCGAPVSNYCNTCN